ncbi:MAG: rod shape-determining protein MreD [Ruminococcaceae bacterium]|nr:rod shape-determining protein MreD [Oscillospiraceae bacterium]
MNLSPSKQMGLRRGLIILVMIASALIQHTPGFNLNIGNLSPMLLIPFTVCVAMYERSTAGLVYGLLAGALWDFASTGADGMFTLMLLCIGFGIGILITFVLRNRLVTSVFLSLVCCIAVSVAYWGIFILRKGYDGTWMILFTHFLPQAVYSAAFVFIYYYLIGFIISATGKNERSKQTFIG